ncbi:putative quinol monooxygenase [Granulicella cerasi]|uniref:Quinol monooxygenase n=1 Tax=Granulicella cerasi TaxID=741063 RepID=A0ABW1Z937_9BACT|nr:putative quinol monooxygenase [Granulicella cerasi]
MSSALRKMLRATVFVVALPASVIHAQTAAPARVYKFVTYTTSPEKFQAFLAQCEINANATRKETGTVEFEVLEPQNTPNTVMFLEEYRNQAASDAHMRTAHFLAFKQAVAHAEAKRSAVQAARFR